jgi:hypothetical protein
MRRNSPSKKVNDGPSAKGGPSVWLLLTAAVMVTAGVLHLARPGAPAKTAEPVGTLLPASPAAVSREYHQAIVFENPQADRFGTLVRDFELETDPGKREDLLAAWLAEVKADEIPTLLEFLQSATPAELAQDLSKRLIRHWTGAAPENAAAWLETLPPEKQTALLDDVAITWANTDPTNAMNWAASLSDNVARGQALATVAGEAVRSQPLMALQIALDLPASESRDDLIRRGAMQWASEDAAGASAWVGQIPQGDLRNQTLSGVAIVWSASAPVDAANWALDELPPGRLLDDTVISIVQRWAKQDMDGATAWVKQFPEGALRTTAMENLLAQASQTSTATTRNF